MVEPSEMILNSTLKYTSKGNPGYPNIIFDTSHEGLGALMNQASYVPPANP